MTSEDLRQAETGSAATDTVVRLYRRAFAEYGTRALWSWQEMASPTVTQALAIAESLRTEGDLRARALAVEIEQACRAAL